MPILLEYIQTTKLPSWDIEEKASGFWLISPDRIKSIAENDTYDLDRTHNLGDGSHLYTVEHLQMLIDILNVLDTGEFEFLKTDNFPLILKGKFLSIAIAPRVYRDKEWNTVCRAEPAKGAKE